MYITSFILLVIVLGIGIALFIAIKMPKLTPKKVIVETVMEANDALFSYRQEIRDLISDGLGLYQQRDKAALVTRHSTANNRKRDLEQKLTNAENNLASYEKVKVQKSFYDLTGATIGTLRQAVSNLNELQNESAALEPMITNLQRISVLTLDNNMTTYIADDDNAAASRVADHVTEITGLLKQTSEQVTALSFQTNEFQRIAQSLGSALKQAEQDYTDLRGLLSSGQYEAYRNKSQSLPNFFARFDMNSYESIAKTTFSHNPEESFINDLRMHLYS